MAATTITLLGKKVGLHAMRDGESLITLGDRKHEKLIRFLCEDVLPEELRGKKLRVGVHRRATGEYKTFDGNDVGFDALRRQTEAWGWRYLPTVEDAVHYKRSLVRPSESSLLVLPNGRVAETIERTYWKVVFGSVNHRRRQQFFLVAGCSEPFLTEKDALVEARLQLSAWLLGQAQEATKNNGIQFTEDQLIEAVERAVTFVEPMLKDGTVFVHAREALIAALQQPRS